MESITIPPREGRGFRVEAGRTVRIVTPRGQQAADFFAFNADDVGEWLSATRTWVSNRCIKPRQGDTLLSRFRRPMLTFDEDGADGVHDMLLAACDQHRYEQLGYEGPHPSCSDNLRTAMQRLGRPIDVIPQPINFFTNTQVAPGGEIVSPPNPVPPGAYVVLRACIDLICVVSACPYDLDLEDWPINALGRPTELVVELH